MAMPIAYNPISLGQIQGEFGGANPIFLSEYYRGAGYTTDNNTTVPTGSAGVTIALSNFYSAYRAYQVEMYFSRDANDTNHIYLNSPGFPQIDITTPVNGGGSIITYYIPTNVIYTVTGANDGGYPTGVRKSGNSVELEDRFGYPDEDWNDLVWTPGAGTVSESGGNLYYTLNI